MQNHFKIIFLAVVLIPAVLQAQDVSTPISQANNEFAVDSYKILAKASETENIVYSPIGLSTVLSMLLEGTPESSDTFKELKKGLDYEKFDLSNIENYYRQLRKSLESNDDYTLHLSNSIWIKDSVEVRDSYKQKVTDVFKSAVHSLSQSDGARQINEYVAELTKNNITKVFDNVDHKVVTVLVNAIYFHASWDKPFNKDENEKNAHFKRNDDSHSSTTVTLMKKQDNLHIFDDSSLKARVLVLNFQGHSTKLAIFLPRSGHTLSDVERELSAEMIDRVIDRAEEKHVKAAIPKFNVSTSYHQLKSTLEKLGIHKIFTNQAEFDKIAENGVKVDQVAQKARIEVSEEGTVAAKAAGVATHSSSVVSNSSPVEFRADHPFVYVLYHKPAKSVVFIGRYTDASE